MKFKINYTLNGQESSFTVEGETAEEIQQKTTNYFLNHGIEPQKVDYWSEKL